MKAVQDAASCKSRAEEEYKTIRTATDGFWLVDVQGRFLDVNDSYCHLVGYSREELLNMQIADVETMESPEVVMQRIRRIIEVGEVRFETRHRHKDGRTLDIEVSANYLDVNGGRLFVSLRDITDRRRAEEVLKESEKRYRRLFESAKDGILILDAETGMVVDVNPFLVELLGYPHERFMAKAIWDLGFLKDVLASQDKFAELKRLEYVRYEGLPLETADGRRIEVEFVSNVYLIDRKKVIQCNIRDITEHSKVLRASETRYRRLFETAQDAILILDADSGRIVDANPFLVEMLGYSLEELLGKELWEIGLFRDITASKKAFAELQDKSYIRYEDLPLETRDGRQVNVEFVSNAYLAGGRKVIQCNIRDITERKRAEEALRVSETRYRRLFETAQDAILILDADSGRIVDANPFLVEMLGYSLEELLGKELWEIGLFRDITASKKAFAELQDKSYIRYEDLPLETRDGRQVNVEFVSNAYLAGDRKVIQCNIRDITERKRAEEALRVSETRYRRLFETAQDAILILDADSGRIVDVNPFLIEMLGYSFEEFVGKELWEIGLFRDIAASKAAFIELRDKGYIRYENLPLQTRDGRHVNVEFVSNAYLVGDREVIQCNIRNITERKRAEETLRVSETRYRRLFETAQDAILILDADSGRIVDVNPFLINMLGYSFEDFLGKELWELGLFRDIAASKAAFIELRDKGYIRYEDLPLETRDGRHVNVEFVSNAYLAGDRKVIQCNIRDITERRRLMMELNDIHQEQMRTKDRLVSHVSHEFRSPLASIYQFATILLDGLAGDISPEQREHLEIVLRNVNQLRSMVDDLLETNHAVAGKLAIDLRYVAPAEMIKEVVETFRRSSSKAMRLSTDIPGDLPPVLADPARVREVLINLLDNATKFTPNNGSIAVQAAIYSPDPNFICIKVSDTGCGISHEEIGNIFDYQYQVDSTIDSCRKGLGLGLFICKELISGHGGRIWAESELGYGSTLSFTLPIFSLSRLLVPIMSKAKVAAGSIAIVTVEIDPVERRSLTRNDESALQEAWNAVRGCIPPGKNALLPMMPSARQGAVFCAVLWANQRDAEALVHRIEEHLARCQSLRNTGLNPVIFTSMLDMPAGRTARKQSEEIMKKIVDKVGEQTKMAMKGGSNDCEKDSHSGR